MQVGWMKSLDVKYEFFGSYLPCAKKNHTANRSLCRVLQRSTRQHGRIVVCHVLGTWRTMPHAAESWPRRCRVPGWRHMAKCDCAAVAINGRGPVVCPGAASQPFSVYRVPFWWRIAKGQQFVVCPVFAVCFSGSSRQKASSPCARQMAHGEDFATRHSSVCWQ